MLLGNYQIYNKNPIQLSGGDSLSGITGLRSNWNQAGISKGSYYGETWTEGVADRFGVPGGYSSPYSWNLPPKSGGIGSNIGIISAGGISGSGALGFNISSDILGLGEISQANLGLILSAVATLSGIGGLSASVVGSLDAAATLAGQGNFTASLGALAGAVAELSGQCTFIGATTAKARISADIFVNQSTASVNEMINGIWNAVASEYNNPSTMGQKLNGAGSAGDPWAADPSTFTPGTAGKLLEKASKPKISL